VWRFWGWWFSSETKARIRTQVKSLSYWYEDT
jgi:hypothetical protein